MIVKLSISGNREAVHAALVELMAITQSTGVIIRKESETQVQANATDSAIRAAAAKTGGLRKR